MLLEAESRARFDAMDPRPNAVADRVQHAHDVRAVISAAGILDFSGLSAQ